MIKAAFFDIDGTLLSFKTHRIPASAQQVLDSFHEQGIACGKEGANEGSHQNVRGGSSR